jgi:hypothetical protein
MKKLLALVVVALVWMHLAVPRPAAANVAAPPPPSEVGAVSAVGDKTPLEVKDAALSIECATREACQLEVSYAISNPTETAIVGAASFYGLATKNLAITIDGTPANVALTPEQKTMFDAEIAKSSDGRAVGDMVGSGDNHVGRQGFALNVAARATVHLAITGTIVPLELGNHGYDLSPDHARHLLLTPNNPSLERIRLNYFVAPIRTWGAVPPTMKLRLSHPAGWEPTFWGADSMTERVVAGRRISEGVMSTSIDTLSMDLVLDQQFELRGGLFAAVGGHVDNASGLRLRLGAEMSWQSSRLISLALELERGGDGTDEEDTGIVIVPAFAFASPMVLFIPSLSIGAGVPIRVSPDVDVGGRIQLDLHVGPVGYFVAFDFYPGMDASPRRFEIPMMFQVSL